MMVMVTWHGGGVLCTEVEMMKERFAKLLLGEDMSGGSKGVCPALALSNAITNLSGTSRLYLFPGVCARTQYKNNS